MSNKERIEKLRAQADRAVAENWFSVARELRRRAATFENKDRAEKLSTDLKTAELRITKLELLAMKLFMISDNVTLLDEEDKALITCVVEGYLAAQVEEKP